MSSLRLAVLAIAVTACGGRERVIAVGAQLGPALSAAFAAADQARAPWRCAAPDGPAAVDETLTIGRTTWKVSGHALVHEAKSDGALVIGAIADAGGAAPTTIAALGRLRPRLARADLVVALGGMGATQAELEATLGAIADPVHPVLAIPGDLESAPALTAAVKALRGRGLPVLDGRLVHTVELPGASLAVIAGAGAQARLVTGPDGCAYRPDDVKAAYAALGERPGIRIAVTAEAPRTLADGEPTGELVLAPGAGQEIDVVLHAPTEVPATRARTGARDAGAVALTPGTADATLRLPGPLRAATAGLLTIHGTAWSWKPVADTD